MPGAFDDLIPAVKDPVLDQVKQRESGGRADIPPSANYDYPRSHASGGFQFQPGTWAEATKATGIGGEYKEAYQAPDKIQRVNAEWLKQKYGANSPHAWGASAPPGGYREPKQTAGAFNDLIPKKPSRPGARGPAGGAFDDLIPKKPLGSGPGGQPAPVQAAPQSVPAQPPGPEPRGQTPPSQAQWRVPAAQEGPRSGPAASFSPISPTDDPSIVARQKTTQPPDLIGKLFTPSQWAQMAHDPRNPMWQRVGLATMEVLRRYGADALGDAAVFGDVASGKASMADPETQRRVTGAAAWFGSRAAPGKPAGIPATPESEAVAREAEARPTLEDFKAEPAKEPETGRDIYLHKAPEADTVRVYHAGEKPTSAEPRFVSSHPDNYSEGGKKPVWYADILKDKLPEGIRDHYETNGFIPNFKHDPVETGAEWKPYSPGSGYVSVGAGAVPTHEVLAQNIKSRQMAGVAADPTLKQKLRSAANFLKAFTAPETMRDIKTGAQTGLEAAATRRKFAGRMQREAEIAKQAFDQHSRLFNDVTPEEGLTVLKWLQEPSTRTSGGYSPTPEVARFMNTFSKEMVKVRKLMESLPKTEDMQFRDNFVTGLWQRGPRAAPDVAGRGGSGYFAKGKVWDTYEEGIRNGGIPLTTNPMEIGLRYIENAYKWLGENQMFDEGAGQGRIVWRNQGERVEGMVPLNGRVNFYQGPGKQAWAAPEYAAPFNNAISSARDIGPLGAGIERLQRATNVATMARLGLSAFHAGLMFNEAMASGYANAIDNLAGGKILSGARKLGEAPAYPLTSLWRGGQAIKGYLNPKYGDPKLQKAISALTDANFRFKGKGNVADEYRATFLPDFWESFKKGRLMLEARQGMKAIAANPVTGPARAALNLTLRGLETTTAPIFKWAVPRLKSGAALDMMQTYMRRMPNATDDQLAAYARRVSNIIDDRFGEMNNDNIFMHDLQKKVLRAAMVSYSYTYGSARSAAGAALDVGKFPKSREWTARMSYPIGLAMAMTTIGAMYQYLKTGKGLSSPQDIRAPQTGGTDPQTGQPGRAVLPSQLNQVFEAMNNPLGVATSKINSLWTTMYDLAQMTTPTGGQDWKGDPLINKNAPGLDQFWAAGQYALNDFMPIQVQQQRQAPEGSAITPPERFFGARDAPRRYTDPEGSAGGIRYVNAEKEIKRRQHLPDSDPTHLPRYIPYAIKQKLILQEMNRYAQ